jgi:hypothetical protein
VSDITIHTSQDSDTVLIRLVESILVSVTDEVETVLLGDTSFSVFTTQHAITVNLEQ